MAVLYVDQVDPQSGTTLTIGTSGDTVTVPSGVTVAGGLSNTPAFYVSLTSNQIISSSTLTTVEFDDEILDSDSTYDTSTYRFTPGVAGTYFFYTRMRSDTGADNNQIQSAALRKNGTIIERSYVNTGSGSKTDNETTGLSAIVPSVSTTDYFDMQIYITDTSGSPSVVGQGSGVHYSTFGGYKLIG